VSQENVDFVHRFYAAFNKRDESALVDLVHPEVEFTSLIQEVEGNFAGHEGLHRYLASLFSAFPDWRVWVDDVTGCGDDLVVQVRVHATSVAGVPADFRDWQALPVREGRAIWWAYFRTKAEALKAVGLEE
jgi:ketosteroid isomerase-like protein